MDAPQPRRLTSNRPRALAFATALLVLDSGRASAFDPDEDRPWRIGAETLGGLVGGAAGVFSVGMVSFGGCSVASGGRSSGCLMPALVGAFVGGAVGIPLGVWGAGELMGADGGLGWTMLGGLSGTAIAATTLAIADIDQGDPGWWFLVVGLPLVGSIAGYELSTGHIGGAHTVSGAWRFLF